VIAPIHRLPILVRLSLLGLLMLAVAFKPMSSLVCDTHQLSHMLAATGLVSLHQDSAAQMQLDADHAKGAHGLLHDGDESSAYVGFSAEVTVPVVRFEPVAISLPTELPVPVQHVTKPFRPPIA
jgi:hypothetical protein